MTNPKQLLEAAELADRTAIDSRFNDKAQAGFRLLAAFARTAAAQPAQASDVEALKAEVRRCWDIIEGLYHMHFIDCGIYPDDEQTRERFNESMQRSVLSKRPARITALLASPRPEARLRENYSNSTTGPSGAIP